MPPKADYWKYFNVVGVVAYCLSENGAIIAGKRPCWRCSSDFGKKVDFLLALIHTIDCPKAHNKTQCSDI